MDGKLVNAYVGNNNLKSKYSGFEIITCREISDYSGGTVIQEVKTAEQYLNADEEAIDEPFYRIFAIYKPEASWETSDTICSGDYAKRKAIGDFYDIKEAVVFLQELTGDHVNIYSH